MNSTMRSTTAAKYQEIEPSSNGPSGASPDKDISMVAGETSKLLPQQPEQVVTAPPQPAAVAESKNLDKILTKVEQQEVIKNEEVKKKLS